MDDTTPQIPDPSPQPGTEVLDLLTVQSSIKNRMEEIERLKNELKPHKEMLDSFLENDPEYMEKTKAAKLATQEKSAVKNRLLKQSQAAQLVDKLKAAKEQIKELEEGLSYYLREYQRLTGANEFEGSDGELRQIVYIAKLVRKTNLNRE